MMPRSLVIALLVIATPQWNPWADAALVQVEDQDELPQGDTPFDQAKRIVQFSKSNGDDVALENLKSSLETMSELNVSQKAEIRAMIAGDTAPASTAPRTPAFLLTEPVTVTRELVEDSSEIHSQPLLLMTASENLSEYELPESSRGLFSNKYIGSRSRYLEKFFWEGETAGEFVTDSNQLVFGDQTVYMGFALLTFAGEARIVADNGGDPTPSERLVSKLLDAFDRLDSAAEFKLYNTSIPGFFVRDSLHKEGQGHPANDLGVQAAGFDFRSDFESGLNSGNRIDPAMSLDQIVTLFAGFWGVAKWSTDTTNVARAKEYTERVMNYLEAQKFLIELPNGTNIPARRGNDVRAAAGFLCFMEQEITGRNRILGARISLGELATNPIRVRDDNLGELTIPGIRVPIDLPVPLSHAFIVGLKPLAITLLAAPEIKVKVSDLFPERARNIRANTPCLHLTVSHPDGHLTPCVHPTALHSGGDPGPTLPCAHLVQAHPSGHKERIPCAHVEPAHPGGDPTPNIPCVHIGSEHPRGDVTNLPCAHMTAKHPAGDKVTLPCAHIGKLHGSHRGPGGIRIPCTHLGPVHSGGHDNFVACVHLVQAHPGGHENRTPCIHPKAEHPGGDPGPRTPCIHLVQSHPDGHDIEIPCSHLTAEHPAGHEQTIPCVHLTVAHRDGDRVPCGHLTAEHPGGHPPEIDLDLTKLDFTIPQVGSAFTRHLALVAMAFEPSFNDLEYLAAAQGSNHMWAMLLRSAVRGGPTRILVASEPIAEDLKATHNSYPNNGASDDPTNGEWVKDSRWVRCTDYSGPQISDHSISYP